MKEMRIKELEDACKDFSKGDFILIKRKSIRMSKYGKSKRFIPRNINYAPLAGDFDKLETEGNSRGYLCTSVGSFYYSKLESVTKINP